MDPHGSGKFPRNRSASDGKHTRNTLQARHVLRVRRVLWTVLWNITISNETGKPFQYVNATFVATIVFILQHALLVVQVVFARREEVPIPDITLDSVDDIQETNIASSDGPETENIPDKEMPTPIEGVE